MRAIVFIPLVFLACETRETDGTDGTDTPAVELSWPTLSCDPIVDFCAFPFPNNVYTEAADTPTGRRLALTADVMPRLKTGGSVDPGPWNFADGFSPGGPIYAHFPGATLEGLAPSTDIAASLEPDALTILINAETGETIPHWAEQDMTADTRSDRAFLIQPAVRLDDATRYIVGIRGLVDADGNPVDPTAAFAAIRSGNGNGDAAVDDRLALYDDIFGHLEGEGWDRSEVLLAWDFTTSSKSSNTDWLVHMRDVALAQWEAEPPTFVIDNVIDESASEHLAYRLEGHFEAPLFLDQPGPGARLLFDADGMPMVNANEPTITVPFDVIIPKSAEGTPGTLLQYGHGLFGDKSQVRSGHFQSWADANGYVMFGTTLIGMADDDESWLTAELPAGNIDAVPAMFDRLHQGFLNQLLAMRLMKTVFDEDATWGSYVTAEGAAYHGISQGGIMGVVNAGLSTDIDRAALGVMGQPYSLLLSRSVDFEPFFLAFKLVLEDGRDVQQMLALAQLLWNRVGPNGWSAYVTEDTVAGSEPKAVFMRDAIGDHQVTTLGAHIMARALDAVHVGTGLDAIWGVEEVTEVTLGAGDAALVEYDFGLPAIPVCNLPLDACDDPHGKLRSLDSARDQLDAFLRTGVVSNTCEGGVCMFAELSGCEPDEDDAAVQAACDP